MADSILAAVTEWRDTWVRPVLGALYEWEPERAAVLLADARAQLAGEQFNPDERLAAELHLARAQYFIDRNYRHPAGLDELFQSNLQLLQRTTPVGPVSRLVHVQLELELRVIADRDGSRELTEQEFTVLIDEIPRAERQAPLWYILSTWLFAHRRVDLLEQAYEILLTSHSHLHQFPFRRVKLMHQLISGTAQPADLRIYLERLTLYNAVIEFQKFFWPEIVAQELDTPELAELVEATRLRLQETPPRSPFHR